MKLLLLSLYEIFETETDLNYCRCLLKQNFECSLLCIILEVSFKKCPVQTCQVKNVQSEEFRVLGLYTYLPSSLPSVCIKSLFLGIIVISDLHFGDLLRPFTF